MAEKVKRTKTKYTGVYFNENTKKYDIKFNYYGRLGKASGWFLGV